MVVRDALLVSSSLAFLVASSFASVVPIGVTATASWNGFPGFTPTAASVSTASDIFPVPSAFAGTDGGSDSERDGCTGACTSSNVASSLSAVDAPTSTGVCAAGCTRYQNMQEYLWHTQQIAATITAATVIYIVDQNQQTISTKTVTNTELDLGNITTPTDVNSAGTRTTKITASGLYGVDPTVVTLTFPSVYVQYGNRIVVEGAVPTTTGGTSSCSQVPGNSTLTLPSHPTVPIEAQRTHSVATSSATPEGLDSVNDAEYAALNERFALDPKGWTFQNGQPGLFNPNTDLYDHILGPLFPDLAYMNCTLGTDVVVNEKPAVKANFAAALNGKGPSLYVTHTTTSPATDSESSNQQSQSPSTQPSKPIVAGKPPTNTASLVTNPSATALPEQIASAQAPSNTPGPVPDVQMKGSERIMPLATHSAPDQVEAAALSGSLLGETPNTQILTAGGHSSTNEANQDGNNAGAVKPQATSTPDIAQNAPASSTPVVVAGQPQSANAIASSVLNVQTQVSGTTPGEATSDRSVAADSSITHPLENPPATNAQGIPLSTTAPVPIILNDQTISPAAGSGYVVAEQTIQPGSTVVLGSGISATTIAVQPASNGYVNVLVGPSSSQLPQLPRTTALAPVVFNGQTLSPNTGTASGYVVAGQTILPGSTIVLGSGISPTTVALQTASNGNLNIIVGSSSSEVPQLPVTTPFVTQLPPFTMGGQTVSANEKGQYIIGNQTVTAGGVVTVSGTPVSIGPSATDVVIGSSTEALGPYIVGGLGFGPGAGLNTTTSPLAFEGHGEKLRSSFGTCCAAVGVIIMMVIGA